MNIHGPAKNIHGRIIDIHSSEDVKFGDSGSAPESQTKIEVGDNGSGNGEITEEDVNERFLNLDLGDFGNNVSFNISKYVVIKFNIKLYLSKPYCLSFYVNQVAASALGTVI